MKNEIIAQSLAQYRQIARLNGDIEQTLQDRDIDTLVMLCETMNDLQEEVKVNDSAVLALLRQQRELHESAQVQELLTLMQEIQERNQRLVPQISGIMAVQRNELQKLNSGNTLLQGYKSAPPQTGKRISSAS